MSTGNKRRILVVDDSEALVATLRVVLEQQGYDVFTAATGEEALRILGEAQPHIIVLDIRMPGIGGIGFLTSITTADGDLSHPVLVLSEREELEGFFDGTKVDGFLPKPCAVDEFLRKVEDILARRGIPELQCERAPAKTDRTILIAENDPEVARRLRVALEERGYIIVTVARGRDVAGKVAEVAPDVVVMNAILPNLNGDVVARRLKESGDTENLPIVLYGETGTQGQSEETVLLRAGVESFVPHNDLRALLYAVERTLGRH